jgi:hypothetical protein
VPITVQESASAGTGASTFLEGVARVLELNGIIRGDTDVPSSFSDTNHNASMRIARLAIQDELASLVADRLIPFEKTSSTITLATSTRTYTLDSTFINFYGLPHFYDATDNRIIPMWPGGQEKLMLADFKYQTTEGTPTWWYWEPTTSKKVGFYHVPNSTYNNRSLTYHFEKSVYVSLSTDTLPFHLAEESDTFCIMAGRRFKFLFEDVKNEMDIQRILDNDISYRSAKGTLIRLMRGTNAPGYYAPAYR